MKKTKYNNTSNELIISGVLHFPISLDFLNYKYTLLMSTKHLILEDFVLKKFANVNMLSNIKSISMKNLHMKNIESNYFVGVYKLEKLIITINNISIIKNYTFKDLRSLYVLYLDYNTIKYIESRAFIGLIMLHTLNLNNNLIKVLHIDTFNSIEKSLAYLYIENNLLSTIDENTLKG